MFNECEQMKQTLSQFLYFHNVMSIYLSLKHIYAWECGEEFWKIEYVYWNILVNV